MPNLSKLATFGLLLTTLSTLSTNALKTYPSSCRDLPDGTYDLKLMDGEIDDSPVVSVQCSNGYIILDVSKDSNLESYFNSFMNFHHGSAGPTNDYQINWEGWYKPDDENTNYLISPDCNTCDESYPGQIYGTKTTYMMTGTLFGCFWNLKGEHNFDQDYDTYQCYYMTSMKTDAGESVAGVLDETSSIDNWDLSGVCSFSVRSSEKTIPNPMTHDVCTGDLSQLSKSNGDEIYSVDDTYHMKPSLGTEGQFCVCAQPSTTQYFELTKEDEMKMNRLKVVKHKETKKIFQDIINTKYDEDEGVYQLYQSDFEDGTYRIQKSGTYRIMEDIEFDFNADYDNPNSDTAWWPHEDQSDLYPGAAGYFDSYFLGFYAGIAVEADDVTIDLNGHELRMAEVFYHQQRWFTVISLTSQYFLPGQGIGFFGADPHFAENIVIKDGTLGLSSHHGIHGHFNKNVLIENVWVKDFETHGIQFNGFDGITINNCEIGPSSEISYFKGEYGHARTLLKRFQEAADNNPDETFKFYGRDEEVTMQDIVDEMQKQVDMAYNHVVLNKQYDENDKSWQSAKDLFLDDTNLPNGAAMYGIFLNTYGASVLTYNLYTSYYSENAVVSNTKIHGLKHAMLEYSRLQYPSTGNLFMNPLHAPFDAEQILEDITDLTNPRYKGSIITDACIALEKLESDNFSLLQAQLLIDDIFLDWALGVEGAENDMDYIVLGCNNDAMIHSGKGINGLRIDAVNNVLIDNVEIYDISEQTPFGKTECGEYTNFDGFNVGAGGGHFRQTLPMQTGFSGTMMQGINVNAASDVILKDINMHDLESYHGPVFGISLWPATNVELQGKIEASLFNAGSNVAKGSLTYESRPNIAPEVCAVRSYSEYTSSDFTYTSTVAENSVNYDISCMDGHASCLDEDGVFTHFGEYNKRCEDAANEMSSNRMNNEEQDKDNTANEISNELDVDGTTIVASSCSGLPDGYHWIKMIEDDDYSVVYQKCSGGYIVLDYSVDNNIADYFNTWSWWHINTAGPTNDVHINWENWYLPNTLSNDDTSFVISPDCNTCEVEHKRQIYHHETAYYMTGTLFGCFWKIKGSHSCDVDWDSDTCYTCNGPLSNGGSDRIEIDDDSSYTDFQMTGICPHNVQASSHWVAVSHDNCTRAIDTQELLHLHVKPSIGTNGQHCVCAKSLQQTQYFEISNKVMPSAPVVKAEEEKPESTTYYLSQKDFKHGTYRIKNPGTYIITEDIEFKFNEDETEDYWPLEDQADEYPGAGDYRDPYFTGFFAGITIETSDVTLDLNGKTLSMAEKFYHQQRWFTTIELSTQYFLPGQGIGNFGGQPQVAENVIIKNGVLGLTSHHGIHGNYNKNILIKNVVVREFETHGIQFNGFDGIKLIDVEVGPTSSKAFFNPEYGHMRLLLRRYKKIAEESMGETVLFDGREEAVSMQDIVDEIEILMEYAKNYVFDGTTVNKHNENYESYKTALELFVNEGGISNGAAQYGIFLNTFGASIFTYNLYTGFYSTNAYLENIKIHGMRHELKEIVRLHGYENADIIINPVNGPLDVEAMFQDTTDLSNPKYKGNILTDAYIASNLLSNSFSYLGLQIIVNDQIGAWAQGADFWESMGVNQGEIQIGCNSDVMIHSGKGINGLRLDGVSDVIIKNLEVYDIVDSTPLGKETCGKYDDFEVSNGESGGHFRQTQPMQVGFSGNMAQAINVNAAENVVFENIKINDISSETGAAFGLSIWPACDVELKGEINVKNVEAGTEIDSGLYLYTDRPNKAPESCGVRVYYEYDSYTTSLSYNDATFNTESIYGHVGCLGSMDQKTMLGEYNNNNNNINKHTESNKANLTTFKYLPEQSINNIGLEILLVLCLVGSVGYYKYKGGLNKNAYKLIDNMDNKGYGSL